MKIDNPDADPDEYVPEVQDVTLPVNPIAEDTIEQLDNYQQFAADDYQGFKENFLTWLLTKGKDTFKYEGYSDQTTRTTHYKVDEAYRWKWQRDGEYTLDFTPEDATTLIKQLVQFSDHPDPYVYTFEKCLKRLFKYQRNELKKDIEEWDHGLDLKSNDHNSEKDKLYPNEMAALYEAALKTSSLKTYSTLSVSERDELKIYLAQKLEKPKDEITPQDFKDVNSWKIPSLIAVTSDTGLRPIEVQRTKVDWFDLENAEMNVPAKQATKNDESWTCVLSSRTVDALSRWIDERASLDKYDGRDELWLTKYGNTYGSSSLNDLLENLIDEGNLDVENRNISWYSFRHGVASIWAQDESLDVAKNQLRHLSIKTTEGYTKDTQDHAKKNADSKW